MMIYIQYSFMASNVFVFHIFNVSYKDQCISLRYTLSRNSSLRLEFILRILDKFTNKDQEQNGTR